ncbi:MAG: hypothetical protein GTO24_24575, partial [candidate division Zixibacteria bacterium]|nr:hypothetical protein [candidate division Zixibacteria bacterium]
MNEADTEELVSVSDHFTQRNIHPNEEEIIRIWKIALLVDDVSAAENLYHEALGMKVISRLP